MKPSAVLLAALGAQVGAAANNTNADQSVDVQGWINQILEDIVNAVDCAGCEVCLTVYSTRNNANGKGPPGNP